MKTELSHEMLDRLLPNNHYYWLAELTTMLTTVGLLTMANLEAFRENTSGARNVLLICLVTMVIFNIWFRNSVIEGLRRKKFHGFADEGFMDTPRIIFLGSILSIVAAWYLIGYPLLVLLFSFLTMGFLLISGYKAKNSIRELYIKINEHIKKIVDAYYVNDHDVRVRTPLSREAFYKKYKGPYFLYLKYRSRESGPSTLCWAIFRRDARNEHNYFVISSEVSCAFNLGEGYLYHQLNTGLRPLVLENDKHWNGLYLLYILSGAKKR